MLELKDTIRMMQLADYRERFKAEYWQTKIRYEKLKKLNTKIEAATIAMGSWNCRAVIDMPIHDCPDDLLRNQQRIMGEYLHVLELRAEIEHVDLEDVKQTNS